MHIRIKSPHQPCNVNRIWIGTASENFHFKFHTTPSHSPQNAGQFQVTAWKRVSKTAQLSQENVLQFSQLPQIMLLQMSLQYTDRPTALLLLQHTNMDRCAVRFIYSEQTIRGKSRTTLTGTAGANCVYIFLSRVILEHYKMSKHRWIERIFPFSTFIMYTSPMIK